VSRERLSLKRGQQDRDQGCEAAAGLLTVHPPSIDKRWPKASNSSPCRAVVSHRKDVVRLCKIAMKILRLCHLRQLYQSTTAQYWDPTTTRRRALSCSLAPGCLTKILGRRIFDLRRPLGSAASHLSLDVALSGIDAGPRHRC